MHKHVDKFLLKKFIDNTCTEEELQQIKKLLKQPGAEQLFEEILNEKWIDIPKQPVSKRQLKDWKLDFYQRRKKSELTTDVKVRQFNRRLLKYAAMFTGTIIGLTIIVKSSFHQKQQIPQLTWQEIKNPYGHRSIIILPDSSTVYLGAGSSLRYPVEFAENKRDIELEGEAFFEIVHQSSKPLIVHTGTIQTRDIGTSFKITAFRNRAYTVEVATGKVSVERLVNNSIQPLAALGPGKAVTWDQQKIKPGNVAVNDITGWKGGRLVFNGTPLIQLTEELERFYDVKIHFKTAKKRNLHISTVLTTADTPINRIMDALSVSAQFSYKIEGKNIWIN